MSEIIKEIIADEHKYSSYIHHLEQKLHINRNAYSSIIDFLFDAYKMIYERLLKHVKEDPINTSENIIYKFTKVLDYDFRSISAK